MKVTRALAIVAGVVITSAGTTGVACAQAAPAWGRDQLAAWYAAFNAGDAKAVAALYAPDAILVPSGKSPLRGRAAIEAYHVALHRATKYSCAGSFDGFSVVAGTAVGWGHDACTETPRAGGKGEQTKSRWLTVYEKQADGKWIIVRDVGEDLKP
jgi:uncharacterized protein (TIGR02246 family)